MSQILSASIHGTVQIILGDISSQSVHDVRLCLGELATDELPAVRTLVLNRQPRRSFRFRTKRYVSFTSHITTATLSATLRAQQKAQLSAEGQTLCCFRYFHPSFTLFTAYQHKDVIPISQIDNIGTFQFSVLDLPGRHTATLVAYRVASQTARCCTVQTQCSGTLSFRTRRVSRSLFHLVMHYFQ